MTLEEYIQAKVPVLFDGAMGTECQKRGLPAGSPPELLNLENPDELKAIHQLYIAAGANLIESNTFGGNRKRLEANGLLKRVKEVNRTAAEAALEAAGGKTLVAGSVGPLGALVEPYGEISLQEARDIFGEQISILREAGIHMILIETMISLEEAVLAFEAARESGATTVGVTMTFEPTPNGPRTAFGESPSQAARTLSEKGAAIVGSNCGSDFETMRAVAKEYLAATDKPILIQPNAGIPSVEHGSFVYPEDPQRFGRFVGELRSIGIPLIGGCCGTTPQHIAVGREVLGAHGFSETH